jgi:hypothetical protein
MVPCVRGLKVLFLLNIGSNSEVDIGDKPSKIIVMREWSEVWYCGLFVWVGERINCKAADA